MAYFNLSAKTILFSVLIGASLNDAIAQDKAYIFREGLIARNVHRYGREAVYQDPLALALHKGMLKTPVVGDALTDSSKWERAVADSAGKFGGRGYWGRGYLYLSYQSEKDQVVLLDMRGNSAVYVNSVLHFGDPYSVGWMFVPVKLKKGLNEFYVRGEYTKAKLLLNPAPLMLNARDLTAADAVLGQENSALKAAIVLINSSEKPGKGLLLRTTVEGRVKEQRVAELGALSMRKVMFGFDASAITKVGAFNCKVELVAAGKVVESQDISLNAVAANDKYKSSFVSDIDGSLQYYAVSPQLGGSKENAALFFSVHGAGVEAIGQAQAYTAKDWGTLVAPTNRRPRGFNWEDWGRLDALEVLSIAKAKFKPEKDHIYLTGHSMGGHGTWFLGATYPGNWAAIAPCAGYPTLKGYGSADGLVPEKGANAMERLLLRASNQSDVPALAHNYKPFGVYVNHGDADPVVSVEYARQMKKLLADFHSDFAYYEYPGGSHWYGNESVDWKPLFDFFKSHKRLADTAVNVISFKTASPGISSEYRWLSILQQQHPLVYSEVNLVRGVKQGMIKGNSTNVQVMTLSLGDFPVGKAVEIVIDESPAIRYDVKSTNDRLVLRNDNGVWSVGTLPSLMQKGPQRYGTFKDPFSQRMVFVYGTSGNKEENRWNLAKATYDAEAWYYRGNGSVDIISDKEYSLKKYRGRNVIIYGNASSNDAYGLLLADCPIQVKRGEVNVGGKIWKGLDLATYFMWPQKNTETNTVAVIAGSGLEGMAAAEANQYFAGASGFPDFMVFGSGLMKDGKSDLKCAGFYDMSWKIGSDIVLQD